MKLLVTGANGFLGKHVVKELSKTKYDLLTPRSRELNLIDKSSVMSYFERHRPEMVLHMAAICGGIGLNMRQPADVIQTNLKMGVNLFDAIEKFDTEYVYGIGSVCAYPANCPVPFKEDDLWNGYPEATNAGYGFSKRALLMQQQEYRKQYGLKGAHFIMVNMYGPHDDFDLDNSHVIAAFIRKFLHARDTGAPTVPCWGTGEATREFLYVGDSAAALRMAVEQKLDTPLPINLGTGKSISIKGLAQLVKQLTGYRGEAVFTGEVSNGQMCRQLDVSRAKEILGFEAGTDLETGLVKTIQWYIDNVKDKNDN